MSSSAGRQARYRAGSEPLSSDIAPGYIQGRPESASCQGRLELLELLAHLDKLKALHRAGESPSFGQVESLFDLAAVVRLSVTSREAQRPAAWPTRGAKPVETAARHLVELVMATLTEPDQAR